MGETKTILLVDDDRFLIDMYTLKFKEAGYGVVPAFNAEEAVNSLKGGLKPSGILLDMVMPGTNGLELLERFKKEKLVPSGTALIVLSNQGGPADVAAAEKLGIDGYIIKASTIPSEVLEKVEHIISEKNKK